MRCHDPVPAKPLSLDSYRVGWLVRNGEGIEVTDDRRSHLALAEQEADPRSAPCLGRCWMKLIIEKGRS